MTLATDKKFFKNPIKDCVIKKVLILFYLNMARIFIIKNKTNKAKEKNICGFFKIIRSSFKQIRLWSLITIF